MWEIRNHHLLHGSEVHTIKMKGTEYSDLGTDFTTWQVMQEYLPKHMLSDFSRRFRNSDPKKIGLITAEDVAIILQSMGYNVTTDDIHKVLQDLTGVNYMASRPKYVDYKEYISVLSVLVTDCIPEDEMYLVFQQFDQDGDGFISFEELKNLLKRFGDDITDNDVKEMMKEADRDGDGKVSYSEFIQVMTNSEGPEETEIIAPTISVQTVPITTNEITTENRIARTLSEGENKADASEMGKDADRFPSKLHRVRSFSLDSTLKPPTRSSRHAQSPCNRRRKISIGEFFHLTPSGRGKNSRQSCPDIGANKDCQSGHNLDVKEHRRFSLSGSAAHLRHLFKKKKHHS